MSDAGEGPSVPCPICERGDFLAGPTSGFWFNPEKPGTGFNLQVQNGLLMGTYYGYTQSGEPVWYLLSGRLERVQGSPDELRIESRLQSLREGACLGCSYRAPVELDANDVITLSFSQRNFGHFSINGGPQTAIVPLVAGIDAPQHFGSLLEYGLPNLEGAWSFVQRNPELPEAAAYRSRALFFTATTARFDPGGRVNLVSSAIFDRSNFPESSLVGSLRCESPFDIETSSGLAPICYLTMPSYFGSSPEGLRFELPAANIGDSRLVGVHLESGLRVEAFRIGYD